MYSRKKILFGFLGLILLVLVAGSIVFFVTRPKQVSNEKSEASSQTFNIPLDSSADFTDTAVVSNNRMLVTWIKQNPNIRPDPTGDCAGETTGLCGNGDVYADVIDLGTGTIVEEKLIAGDPDLSTIINAEHTNITYNSQLDEYILAWQEYPADGTSANWPQVCNDIYLQRIKVTNTNQIQLVGGRQAISNGPECQWVPKGSYNSNRNELIYIWHDHRNRGTAGVDSQKDIYAQIFKYQGIDLVPQGSNFPITLEDNGDNALYYQQYSAIVYNPQDNKYLAVWGDERNRTTHETFNIWGEFLNSDGSTSGNNFEIVNIPSVASTEYPSLEYISTTNGYLLTWTQKISTNNYKAGFVQLDSSGAKVGQPQTLSLATGSNYITYPAPSCKGEYCEILWRDSSNAGLATYSISNGILQQSSFETITVGSYFSSLNSQIDDKFYSSFLSGGQLVINSKDLPITSTVSTPTITPNGGEFTTTQSVTLNTTTTGATIRYTTNGTDPDESSTAYEAPFELSQTTTVKAKAYKSGMNPSSVESAQFTKVNPPTPTVETPIIDPNGGNFTTDITVTISTETTGATIRYTTNGTEPSESSNTYNQPLTLSETTTLKAKAFKESYTASATATAQFTKVDPPEPGTVSNPVITPNGGEFTTSISVTIETETQGAEIYYTTNGQDPNESSTLYNRAIEIVETATLKAKAFKNGMNPSSVVSATFTKQQPTSNNFELTITNIGFNTTTIPILFEVENGEGETVYSTNTFVENGEIQMILNSTNVPIGIYTIKLTPRNYTTDQKSVNLTAYGPVQINFDGSFLAGSYTQSNGNTQVTIADLSLAISYFKHKNDSKDLTGDGKFKIDDLAKIVSAFKASN